MLYIYVANLSDFPTVKKFVNWLRFNEIIVTVGWCIFETQCMMPLIVLIVVWKSRHEILYSLVSDQIKIAICVRFQLSWLR